MVFYSSFPNTDAISPVGDADVALRQRWADGLTLDGVWRWRYRSRTVFLITVVSTFIQMIANQREKFQTSAIGAVELALCRKTKREMHQGWMVRIVMTQCGTIIQLKASHTRQTE